MSNPIKKVGTNTNIPVPSSYVWKQDDVSADDAGRTEDAKMHKKRIGKVIGIELSWQNITTSEASAILKAFDPEYLMIEYLDPKVGGYVTSEFYVGNRTSPLYNATKAIWSNVSFNLIKRSAR